MKDVRLFLFFSFEAFSFESFPFLFFSLHSVSKVWQKLVLVTADSTSHAKQLKGMYEQIPQALVSLAVSCSMDTPSIVVGVCVLAAGIQVILVHLVRPYVLCAEELSH